VMIESRASFDADGLDHDDSPTPFIRLWSMLKTESSDIGIIIVPQAALEHAPGALRRRVEESTTPVVFPLGTQHNEDIRAQIVKIIGVDLWK